MAKEAKRGCGYRKIGALYLVCDNVIEVPCDRMPILLEVCPTCGHGLKPQPGFAWINAQMIFEGPHLVKRANEVTQCSCFKFCPACHKIPEKAGLMWVGSKFYTPKSFIEEAMKMGISKRIKHIPKDLEFGKTWVFLAHKEAFSDIDVAESLAGFEKSEIIKKPGIFYAFKPTKVEMLVPDTIDPKEEEELIKKGITPIKVPANDKDHQGSCYRAKNFMKKKKRGPKLEDFLKEPVKKEVAI